MLDLRLHDLESLEAIAQDDEARPILLRMAAMSQSGRTPAFLHELAKDADLDDATKTDIAELAGEHEFLLAVEEYLRLTGRAH